MKWDRFEQDMGCCGDFSILSGSSLVLTILSLLSDDLHALFRARCICKSWYDAVLSPQFRALHSQYMLHHKHEPWAMLRTRIQAPITHLDFEGLFNHELHYDYFDYDNQMESRIQLWRPRSGIKRITSLQLGPSSSFLGLASSAGLVCGRLMEYKDTIILVVGNPITRLWVTLPPAPVEKLERPPFWTVEFISDDTGTYKVILFEVGDESPWTLIYDSRTQSWQQVSGFDTCDAVPNADASALSSALAFGNVDSSTVVALDATTMAWKYIHLTPPAADTDEDGCSVRGFQIFKHSGSCILAGCYHQWLDGEDPVWLGFGVWILDMQQVKWSLVSRVSTTDVFGNGCNPSYDSDVKVQLSGDMLFFSTWYKNSTFASWPSIAYDFITSCWHCCKDKPATGLYYNPDVDFECISAFVPSLQ